eukprot:9220293-Karenia_brevis.AAC.1
MASTSAKLPAVAQEPKSTCSTRGAQKRYPHGGAQEIPPWCRTKDTPGAAQEIHSSRKIQE